jgi:hypothetical protein
MFLEKLQGKGILGEVLRCSRERRGWAYEKWLRTGYMVDCGAAFPKKIGLTVVVIFTAIIGQFRTRAN